MSLQAGQDEFTQFKLLRKSLRRQGVGKLLVSNRTFPWVFLEALITWLACWFGAQFSPFWGDTRPFEEAIVVASLFTFFLSFAGLGWGLFDHQARLSRVFAVRAIVLSSLSAALLSLATYYVIFFLPPGRYILGFGVLSSITALTIWHSLLSWLVVVFPRRYVFLGHKSDMSTELERALVEQAGGVSALKDGKREEVAVESDILTALESEGPFSVTKVLNALIVAGVSDLIVTRGMEKNDRVTQLCTRAMNFGFRVVDEAELYAEVLKKYPVSVHDVQWALTRGFDVHKPLTNITKRAFDIFFALLGIVLLSPLLLLLALLVLCSGPGGVIFRQQRRGRFFEPFTIYKFRSMKAVQESTSNPFTSKGDDRITFAGRFMRPLHLDELPQLWNILIGDMSFVGPRPALYDAIREIRKEIPFYDLRHMLRPGLTGLAQITQGHTANSKEEIQEKLGFDLFYIRNYGVFVDLWIIIKTLFTLTKRAW